MTVSTLLTWREIWALLGKEQQKIAVERFTAYLITPECKSTDYNPFIRKLAKRLCFRVQTVKQMPTNLLNQSIHRTIFKTFQDQHWRDLFFQYYTNEKSLLLCRFLDLCGIVHNEHGGIDEDIKEPENITEISDILIGEFGLSEVTIYFSVLMLRDPEEWPFLAPIVPGLVAQINQKDIVKELPINVEMDRQESIASTISEDFTQLDRVLIDQILCTAAKEDRALNPDELTDLLETVHALDSSRKRTYFHLGFMDTLIPDREPNFNRQEFNDARRGWYLTGVLSGSARHSDSKRFRTLIEDQADTYEKVVNVSGGAGSTMLNSIYTYLIELGLIAEAIILLYGQAEFAQLPLIEHTFKVASTMLRSNDLSNAHTLLKTLSNIVDRTRLDNANKLIIKLDVDRKLGQFFQMQGNFEAAKSSFEPLLKKNDAYNAKVLADLGMVVGGFRNLKEIWIKESLEQRQAILDGLEKGKPYFERAVDEFGAKATNAQYALAIHAYLGCINPAPSKTPKNELRTKALSFINNALSSMALFESLAGYEELGLVGRARFVQAVLQMTELDLLSAKSAMESWRLIKKDDGQLPSWDLRQLIEAAEAIDTHYAVEISESIWRHRKADAWDIINAKLVTQSPYLCDELHQLAKEASGETLWNYWTLLIPVFLAKEEILKAEEGLDKLENLAVNGRFAEQMLQWLATPSHYEPAWSEEDVIRTRVFLLRMLGHDTDAFIELRRLFFLVRDRKPELASSILDLFQVYKAEKEHYSDLVLPAIDQVNETTKKQITTRLEEGEQVHVLFIGGYETQAKYDGAIVQSINDQWPGVTIKFEHTGWSSNWGRQLNHLRKQALESDAIVIMQMMRTELGKKIRKFDIPWIACTNTGKKSMTNSIRHAARIGLEHGTRKDRSPD